MLLPLARGYLRINSFLGANYHLLAALVCAFFIFYPITQNIPLLLLTIKH